MPQVHGCEHKYVGVSTSTCKAMCKIMGYKLVLGSPAPRVLAGASLRLDCLVYSFSYSTYLTESMRMTRYVCAGI